MQPISLSAKAEVSHMHFLEPKLGLGWFLEIPIVILSNSHTQTKAIKLDALAVSHDWNYHKVIKLACTIVTCQNIMITCLGKLG